ncbi:MAG: ATP-binding cassette subfamily B multidrug efflux pump [Chlamydiales bacterium]|jgi:ATP-binding cassette subfamily B multidrug efflux pump
MSESETEVIASKVWDHSLFRRLLTFARPHARLFMQSFLVLAGLLVLDLIGPWIWRRALDGPVAASRAEGIVDRAAHIQELWFWIALFMGLVLVRVVFCYLETAQLTRTGQAVVHDLRVRLFRHIQSLDLRFFDKQPTGSLVTRVTGDIENLNEMFTSGVVVLAFDLIKVGIVLCILFFIHWKLALVVLVLTPLLIGISIAFRGGARRAHRVVRAHLARLNGYLQEVLSGIRVVQVFRREQRVSERFQDHLDGYFKANRRTIYLFALFYPAMSSAVYLIQGVTLWVVGQSFIDGGITYGVFVQFWFYLNLLVRPIRELGERYNVMQSAFASAERVFQILDMRPHVRPPAEPRQLPTGTGPGHVRFENVSFSYIEGKQVLSEVSFDIPPGHTVAIVGATGSGKSTLVNLLLRYYDPSAGRITLDGIDIAELDPRALRQRFGLVLQEDFLFAGSVRDNLVMERPEVDEASLQSALSASRADALLERLPGGLSAQVAERGATFSTGQRQLLAIARALAGRPGIVILDEATASIDSATEAQIEQATNSLLKDRSGLVIAHRLSTIRRADQILVMHKGELRERGTHSELLEHGGLYARLHALQFAAPVA